MMSVVAHVRWSSMDWMERADRFTLGLAAFTEEMSSVEKKYGEEESEDILEPEMIKALASCTHEKSKTEFFVCFNGQMGVKYGCPVEDIITGLSIQCRGWKSAYLTPKKKAFLGVAPTNLHQMLGQQRRDGQRVSSWWFILFGYVAAAANAYSLAVFLWCGGTSK
ncbi:BnaCnng25520D [Brassica napus]|uniref:BnaCnng25520D protein n=2 Tax=Brassica napus TaxID=3708 RepID=A0A078IRS3_BRANA|nr:BnaCnng25520D [Brassica napus]